MARQRAGVYLIQYVLRSMVISCAVCNTIYMVLYSLVVNEVLDDAVYIL